MQRQSFPGSVRKLSALVALAFTAGVPFAAYAENTPGPGAGSLDVWFKSPLAGRTVSGTIQGSTCYVNATGSISRVQFLIDGKSFYTDNVPGDGMQCRLDTTTLLNGAHALRAVAFDSSGNSRVDQISINVQNTVTAPQNQAPTISLTAPTTGVTGSVAYSATAADDKAVSRVDFTLDGTALKSLTAAPYAGTIDVSKMPNGAHALKATAYDAEGLNTSSQVSLNVQNPVVTAPSTSTEGPRSGSTDVWFKSPTAGKTVSGLLGGSTCYVAASGSISRVVFTIDGKALNTDSTPADGMQCALDTTALPNGTHALRATAFDSSGGSRADQISINVQNSGSTGGGTTQNTPPSVSLSSPAVGASLSGTNAACAATASDDKGVAKVDFLLTSSTGTTTTVTSDTTAPYDCAAFDTTKFANGTYNFSARATDSEGASSTSAVRTVSISNTVTQPPAGSGAISSSDIIDEAQAGIAFSQQSGYTAGVMGNYWDAPQIPESGINGPTLSNGETLRLGKQNDPAGSGKKVLAFQLSPNDPITSGSKRSEIEFGGNIQLDKVYWVAYSIYIPDWGNLPSGDESLFGTQVHSSDTSRGLSPAFTTATFDGRTYRIGIQYKLGTGPTPSNTTTIKVPDWSQPGIPVPFGRWADFVFKFRESQSSSGFLQGWQDGNQIVNYSGPLGYLTPGFIDYFKFGYYNWSDFNSSRKVLLRSPIVVQDPTGSKYTANDLRSYVQAR